MAKPRRRAKKNGAHGRKNLVSTLTEGSDVFKAWQEAPEASEAKKEASAILRSRLEKGTAGRGESLLHHPNILGIGTPMEQWMADCKKHSVLPPELAFWPLFQRVSHWMMERGGKLLVSPSSEVKRLKYMQPNLYCMHVAPSGAGKGVVQGVCSELLPIGESADGIGSTQAFYQWMSENDGKAAFNDVGEWAPFWELVKKDPSMGQIVRPLLNSYQQEPLELKYLGKNSKGDKTSDGGYNCDYPMLSVAGWIQPDRLFEVLQPDDYTSGFVRRFLFCFGRRPKLTMADSPSYDTATTIEKLHSTGAVDRWSELLGSTTVHDEYTISDADNQHMKYWNLYNSLECGLDDMFIQGYLYHTRKFAMVYHVLNGCEGSVIQRREIQMALELAKVSMMDIQHLCGNADMSEIGRLYLGALEIKRAIWEGTRFKRDGTQVTREDWEGKNGYRYLHQTMNLKDAQTAKAVWELVSDADVTRPEDIPCPTEATVVDVSDSELWHLNAITRTEVKDAMDHWQYVELPQLEDDEDLHMKADAHQTLVDILKFEDEEVETTIDLLREVCPQLTDDQRAHMSRDIGVRARVRVAAGIELDKASEQHLESTPFDCSMTEERKMDRDEFVRSYVRNGHVFDELYNVNSPVPTIEDMEAETDIVLAELAKPISTDVDEFGLIPVDPFSSLRMDIDLAWSEYKPANFLFETELEAVTAARALGIGDMVRETKQSEREAKRRKWEESPRNKAWLAEAKKRRA